MQPARLKGALTVGEVVANWYRDHKRNLTSGTQRDYEGRIRRDVAKIAAIDAEDLARNPRKLRAFYASLTPTNARRVHAIIRQAFQDALAHAEVARNPCDVVRAKRPRAAERLIPSPTEVEKMILAAEEEDPIWGLFLNFTGHSRDATRRDVCLPMGGLRFRHPSSPCKAGTVQRSPGAEGDQTPKNRARASADRRSSVLRSDSPVAASGRLDLRGPPVRQGWTLASRLARPPIPKIGPEARASVHAPLAPAFRGDAAPDTRASRDAGRTVHGPQGSICDAGPLCESHRGRCSADDGQRRCFAVSSRLSAYPIPGRFPRWPKRARPIWNCGADETGVEMGCGSRPTAGGHQRKTHQSPAPRLCESG